MEHDREWQEVTDELTQASIELNKANERYHNAILARIALRTIINKENK